VFLPGIGMRGGDGGEAGCTHARFDGAGDQVARADQTGVSAG
jgi:hypothetical protein